MGINSSQNPVSIAMPISIGKIIRESIITAPNRAPRPASSFVCSVILFFDGLNFILITIQNFCDLSYYKFNENL